MVTYTVEEDQLLNSWYLQVPIFLILIEIIVLCVVRCILAYLKIAKYADERRECTAEPNLDTSYFVEPSNSSVSDQRSSNKPVESAGKAIEKPNDTAIPKPTAAEAKK